MAKRPNLVFLLADQLRAASLPVYGEKQIDTPHLDRLAADGVTFTNCISTCPVCTPYRSMLVTGRHPQTTGHVVNFVRTRHDEISIGDAFARAGYRTAWIGKWHLHTGCFPTIDGRDFVPEGRDRLGFDFWRAYNFHMTYFKGMYNMKDWRVRRWEGYETEALNRFAFEFLDEAGDAPFCLFVSPHQPHHTPHQFAPENYYERLPKELKLPENAQGKWTEKAIEGYRHYLAMTLAVDDMVGELRADLERRGLAENTLFVFTSDHGSQFGAHEIEPWRKLMPYEESIRVPLIASLPGVLEGGKTRDTLMAPVDFFPTLSSLCGVPIPRSVEGFDLSQAWRGAPGAFEQDAVLLMSFTDAYDYLINGNEWRGVRTKDHCYSRWLNGKEEELYDLRADPLEMRNLQASPQAKAARAALKQQLENLMAKRGDVLGPCEEMYGNWFDYDRRVVRNAFGPLSDPESEPDWSLLA